MYGNGALIIGMKTIKTRRLMGRSGMGIINNSECGVADRVSTNPTSAVPPNAAMSPRTTATQISVFVLRYRTSTNIISKTDVLSERRVGRVKTKPTTKK